jgi:hypothetical protein
MIYRPENGDLDKDDNLDSYYKRKQSVKHNQLKGEAEVLHDKDSDAESRNFSYGRDGYSKPKEKPPGKNINPNSHSIWDDAAWKDKEQHE